jgi:hypothetical protein
MLLPQDSRDLASEACSLSVPSEKGGIARVYFLESMMESLLEVNFTQNSLN